MWWWWWYLVFKNSFKHNYNPLLVDTPQKLISIRVMRLQSHSDTYSAVESAPQHVVYNIWARVPNALFSTLSHSTKCKLSLR